MSRMGRRRASVANLHEALEKRGLDTLGFRAELQARLDEALAEEARLEAEARRQASAGPKPPRFLGSRDDRDLEPIFDDSPFSSTAELLAAQKAEAGGFEGSFCFLEQDPGVLIDERGWRSKNEWSSDGEGDIESQNHTYIPSSEALFQRKILFHIYRELSWVNGPPPRSSLKIHQVCRTWREATRSAWFLKCQATLGTGILEDGPHSTPFRVDDIVQNRFSVTALMHLDASRCPPEYTVRLAKFLGIHP